MPLEFNINVNDIQDVSVWDIKESIEELKIGLSFNEIEMNELDRISHEKGKKHWLAIRQLARISLKSGDQIVYDHLGVPSLKGHDIHISLSHSENKVAISCNKKYETGIDIQYFNEKILNIKNKFCNEFEKQWLPLNDIHHLHLLWGAKESLFKYYTTQMPFKEVEVQPFTLSSSGRINAVRKRKDKSDEFQLTYRIFDSYYLIYLSNIISIDIGTSNNTRAEATR